MLEYFAVPLSSCWTSSCAVDAERLGAAVDVEPVTGFVLHLGEQRHLPPQVRRARDPVALGQHPDDLGVRVLRHHPDELLAGTAPASSPSARSSRRARCAPRTRRSSPDRRDPRRSARIWSAIGSTPGRQARYGVPVLSKSSARPSRPGRFPPRFSLTTKVRHALSCSSYSVPAFLTVALSLGHRVKAQEASDRFADGFVRRRLHSRRATAASAPMNPHGSIRDWKHGHGRHASRGKTGTSARWASRALGSRIAGGVQSLSPQRPRFLTEFRQRAERQLLSSATADERIDHSSSTDQRDFADSGAVHHAEHRASASDSSIGGPVKIKYTAAARNGTVKQQHRSGGAVTIAGGLDKTHRRSVCRLRGRVVHLRLHAASASGLAALGRRCASSRLRPVEEHAAWRRFAAACAFAMRYADGDGSSITPLAERRYRLVVRRRRRGRRLLRSSEEQFPSRDRAARTRRRDHARRACARCARHSAA